MEKEQEQEQDEENYQEIDRRIAKNREIEQQRQLFTIEREQLGKTQRFLESKTETIQREEREKIQVIELEEREERHRQQRQFNRLRTHYETELNIQFESNKEFNEFLELLELEKKPLVNYPAFHIQKVFKEYNNDYEYVTTLNVGPSQPLKLQQLSQQVILENYKTPIIQLQLQNDPKIKPRLLKIMFAEESINMVEYNVMNKKIVDYVELIQVNNANETILNISHVHLLPTNEDSSHILEIDDINFNVTFHTIQNIVEVNFYAIDSGNDNGDNKDILVPLDKNVVNPKTLSVSIDFSYPGRDVFLVHIFYHNNQVQKFIIRFIEND